ncbi:MAG: hypothetical protein KC486_21785, partial [Myxococcales bacterium]|nr:hypothetical protein [Myxococcales bacterium]
MHVQRSLSSILSLSICGLGLGCNGGSETTEAGSDTQTSITSASASTTTTTTGSTTEVSSESDATSSTGSGTDTGPTCDEMTCPDGVCLGGVCCGVDQACGDVCCEGGAVCSFQECQVPGATCVDATDCAETEYCEYTLGEEREPPDPMCMGGASLATGKCLPKPPECEDGVEPDPDAITCLVPCEVMPPVDDFAIELKHYWGGEIQAPTSTDVMMTPIVIQLDDDNCDGKVNEKDIPELVFSTFSGGAYYKQGTLHAISIVDGQIEEKWTLPDVTQPGGGLAGGDLDNDGVPEIVACANPGPGGQSCCDALAQNTGVVALKADGSNLWSQLDTGKVHCGYEKPAIGDVNQDGVPEV